VNAVRGESLGQFAGMERGVNPVCGTTDGGIDDRDRGVLLRVVLSADESRPADL